VPTFLPDEESSAMSQQTETQAGSEPAVLVVDDAAVDRRITGAIIEHSLGWPVDYAEDGASALAAMGRALPRLVLTDLRMPGMDGLELVKAIRTRHAAVPVVLMTAFGNEDIAIQALRDGAASYVPKKSLDSDLAATLEQVVAAAQTERRQQRLLERLATTESHFVLENDRSHIPALVRLVQEHLVRMGLCDQTERIRVGVALEETLLNAIYHGNLEVSSEFRQQGDEPFHRLADERRGQSPYQERTVHFTWKLSRSEAVFVVRNQGPGFDPSTLPDPTDPANLGRVGGRGLLLIRTFMDEVLFAEEGRQITLVKRRALRGESP
jgi:CheY-like chemotaxis protein/anti-sigma regulatory factor (Ser/Thr protein kinase)